MKGEPLIMSERLVANCKRTLKVTFGVTCAWLAVSGFGLLSTRVHASDLASRSRTQKKTLASIRQSTSRVPIQPVQVDIKSNNVVARLQTALERAARSADCTITEFQATPDRTAYLSAFTLNTNLPDWEQITIRLALNGTLAATLATVESLRSCGTPFEPDSLEITRQTITQSGVTLVALRLSIRVLVRIGGAS